MTDFQFNDGGRAEAGYKGYAGDCVCRAIAIALELDYKETYLQLARLNKIALGKRSARNGVAKDAYEKFLKDHGWVWHKAPKFEGRKAKHYDMPEGVVIARMAKHLAAVVDGVVHDTWDSTQKMVYGYYAPATLQD